LLKENKHKKLPTKESLLNQVPQRNHIINNQFNFSPLVGVPPPTGSPLVGVPPPTGYSFGRCSANDKLFSLLNQH
jgi:hypothetical protein